MRQPQARGLDFQREAGELWADAIVKIITQPPALLLACQHQLLARALEGGRQAHGMRGHADLARQDRDQPSIRRIKDFTLATRPENEVPQHLALVQEWQT